MNLGIDLGTSRVVIYDPAAGVVLDEPAVIAVARDDGHVIACGAEAEEMLGRTPASILAVRPVQKGVIAEYELAEKLLRHCLHRVCSNRITKPCVAVSVAEKVTEVEQRSFIEAVVSAGARRVTLVPETVGTGRIQALFDVIGSSPAASSSPGDYVNAHQVEYSQLLYYSDYTLRFIVERFLAGEGTDLQGQLMRIVLDDLAPESALRLLTSTGQEYFDAWLEAAERMLDEHGGDWMAENQRAAWYALQIASTFGRSRPAPEDPFLSALPMEFEFLSGVGAWSTTLTLNPDLTFTGRHALLSPKLFHCFVLSQRLKSPWLNLLLLPKLSLPLWLHWRTSWLHLPLPYSFQFFQTASSALLWHWKDLYWRY